MHSQQLRGEAPALAYLLREHQIVSGFCVSSWGEWSLLSSFGEWAFHCGASLLVEHVLQIQASVFAAQSSVVVAHGLICSMACGILLDHMCPLNWEADSSPLDHQGSSRVCLLSSFSHVWLFVTL